MSLHYLSFSALDLAAWDACVTAACPTLPYAYAWWLRVVAGHWDAVVELGPNGEYRSVLPLPYKRRPWGRELFQPAFTQQLGLFTTPASQHKELVAYIMLISGRFVRGYQQVNVDNSLFPTLSGYQSGLRRTYHLGLSAEYPTLRQGYAADYRRRLQRAAQDKAPLLVQAAADPAAIIQLFSATKGAAAGLRPRHYRQLQQLLKAAQWRGQLVARQVLLPASGALLAGALFVRERNRLIYLFAAASPEGKRLAAPLLLLDSVIREHAATPGLVLDFEGSMIPSIARFFANFGAQPVLYAAFTITSRPWYLQWLS